MGLSTGIIGLPNVGKSTVFNALSGASAAMAAYAFTTIEPNRAVVEVPDPRLARISCLLDKPKPIPATTSFIDIAGLVRGASKGEGLGNEFLGHIHGVDALVHVVRCFRSAEAEHVLGGVDPRRDIEVVNTELALADLAQVEREQKKQAHLARLGDKAAKERQELLDSLVARLNEGMGAPSAEASPALAQLCRELGLITTKPVLYVLNLGDDQSETLPGDVLALAAQGSAQVLALKGRLEQEISQLGAAERDTYREAMGLDRAGLDRLVEAAYRLLGLITYYTATTELQAWAIPQGTTAQAAAGRIHTDFQRGFIRADVVHYEDLVTAEGLTRAREKGHVRSEGRDYVVKDGDVIHYHFNV